MGRAPCFNKSELKKGPWTPEEDQKLMDYIQKHGHGSWRSLPKNAGLSRCGKSCRIRWMNYLRPDIKRGRFSFEEEETIIQLHRLLGNKWSAIAARLPGRTDTEIKNYWNSHIRKRLLRMGIDPITHGPCINLPENSLLFSQSLYNPTQLLVSRLLGLKPLLHSKLLAMATNILSSQYQHSNLSPQNLQELHFNSPQTQDPFPCIQNNQLQNPIQEIPTGLSAQYFNETNPWQDNMTLCDFVQDVELESFAHQIPTNSDLHVDNDQSFLSSVLSTLALSPSQSNFSSTYINTSTEEKGEGDCSEVFNIQIPELFDVTEFM